MTKDGKVQVDIFDKYKIICYLFSGHWCPPCKTFLPEIISQYKQFKEKKYQIEIVLISCDKSPKDFQVELSKIPFLALPKEEPYAAFLKKQYKINGIPQLIVVDKNGETITKDGRVDLAKYGADAYLEWLKY